MLKLQVVMTVIFSIGEARKSQIMENEWPNKLTLSQLIIVVKSKDVVVEC